jgi:hypothetical protein
MRAVVVCISKTATDLLGRLANSPICTVLQDQLQKPCMHAGVVLYRRRQQTRQILRDWLATGMTGLFDIAVHDQSALKVLVFQCAPSSHARQPAHKSLVWPPVPTSAVLPFRLLVCKARWQLSRPHVMTAHADRGIARHKARQHTRLCSSKPSRCSQGSCPCYKVGCILAASLGATGGALLLRAAAPRHGHPGRCPHQAPAKQQLWVCGIGAGASMGSGPL